MTALALGAAAAASVLMIVVVAPHTWVWPILTISTIANFGAVWFAVGGKLLTAAAGAREIDGSDSPADGSVRTRGFSWLLLISVLGYAALTGFLLWLSSRAATAGLRDALVVASAVVAGFPAGHAVAFVWVALRVRRAEGDDVLVWDSAKFWRGGRTWEEVSRVNRLTGSVNT